MAVPLPLTRGNRLALARSFDPSHARTSRSTASSRTRWAVFYEEEARGFAVRGFIPNRKRISRQRRTRSS